MAMREIVTGGAACVVPGSSSSSNPLDALANTLIGPSSKPEESFRGIPTSTPTISDDRFLSENNERHTLAELEHQQLQLPHPNTQGSVFIDGFHSGLAEAAWDDIHRPHSQIPHSQGHFSDLDRIYDQGVDARLQPTMDGNGNILEWFFELNCAGDRDMKVSTSAMVDGVADCLNGLSGLYNDVKEPSISTILMNFENKFDPYNAMSTPLYQTTTFKQTRKVGRVARAICIMSHPIPNTLESHSVQIILPQKQLGSKSDMYLFCCSYSHNVAPKGKFFAFVSTEAESDQPEIELKPEIDLLQTFLYKCKCGCF